MKVKRLLLPFTHGLDMFALEHAVTVAHNHHITLVAVAFLHASDEQRARGLRLEHVQQAKDFLEAIQRKAMQRPISLERLEIITNDVVQSIDTLTREKECDGILLCMRGKKYVLLEANEVKLLKEKAVHKLYLLHAEQEDIVNLRLH